MTQEFVALPRKVVQQALEAFNVATTPLARDRQEVLKAMEALRAALDQPKNHVPDAGNMVPAGWKLVPVEPNCSMVLAGERSLEQHDFLRLDSAYRSMLAAAPQPPAPGCKATKRGDHVVCDDCKSAWDANDKNPPACVPAPPAVEQPQGDQLAMTPIAQRKLDSLLTEGYTISGYSVYHERKHQHGFVTGAGLVGWWKPEGVEYPKPHGEPSTVAFCHVGDVVVCDNDSLLRQLGVKRSDKLYLHPQDLNCKSKQALLATLWGYTKEQPKRPPLTDEEIDKIAESMPGGLDGFLKGWGWRQFARAVLEATHNIK